MSNLEQPPVEAPEFGTMERLRSSRVGQFITAGLATLALAGATEAANMAFNAEPVSGEGVPTADSPTITKLQANCTTTDVPSGTPEWHMRSYFTAPGSKKATHTIKPGGVARLQNRISGGNIDAFSLLAGIYYYSSPHVKVLKRGSHPSWSPAGGDPHWHITNLCHWSDKRNINFLMKVDKQAKIGHKVCLALFPGGRSGSASFSGKERLDCLKVV